MFCEGKISCETSLLQGDLYEWGSLGCERIGFYCEWFWTLSQPFW